MGFCSPNGILLANQLFFCQDNWFLIGLGAIVLIVIAALVLAVVIAHLLSLIDMVEWWDNKKEREEDVITDLTKRVNHLEETIARYGILSPGQDAESEVVE